MAPSGCLLACYGVRQTVSKSELCSPNRLALWEELIRSRLTLPTVPRMSVSLLSCGSKIQFMIVFDFISHIV